LDSSNGSEHAGAPGKAAAGDAAWTPPWTLAGRLKETEAALAATDRRLRALESERDAALAGWDTARRRHERHVDVLEERVRALGLLVREEVAAGLVDVATPDVTPEALATRLKRLRELVETEVTSTLLDSLILPGPG
jgi:hypothetical protein